MMCSQQNENKIRKNVHLYPWYLCINNSRDVVNVTNFKNNGHDKNSEVGQATNFTKAITFFWCLKYLQKENENE